MSDRTRTVIAATLALLLLAQALPAVAQQADAEMDRLRDDFTAAVSVFESINQPDSIPDFSRIITVLQRRLAAADDEVARELLVASLAYRARAQFNVGSNEEAEADVRALIAADPSADLDRSLVSPRFVELFDGIHAGMVGYFEFAVSPTDTDIRVDGRLLDPGVLSYAVIAGTHPVVVERAGYQPVQEEREVGAGESVLIDHALVRLSAVVNVLTRPPGARVTVDGTAQGVTDGTAPPGFSPTGDAALYPTSDFSDALVIQGLQPGRHNIDVALDGYRPRRLELDIPDLGDYWAPIALEETGGTVVLEGLPLRAEVTVDGAGVTPQRPGGGGEGAARLELPPGTHTLEVSQGTAGVFNAVVDVVDQGTEVLQVRLLPGLAYLGVLGDDERGARDLSDRLLGTLGAIDSWTVLDRTWAAAAFDEVGLTTGMLRPAAEQAASAPDWRTIQARFDREAPGSVYLLAVLNDDLLATYADLWIWPAAPGPAQPDRVRVRLDNGADVATLAGAFQTSTFLSGTWVGAQLVDVGDAVIVTSVSAGGPAEAGGLMVGDRVVSIAGSNLTDASAARRQIAATEPGTAVAIQVQRGAATEVAEVTLGESPQIISPSDPQLVYSVISASLAAEAGDAAAAEPQWVVRLNQAAVLIHAGAWEEVVRVLRGIENAPAGAGVGQATVDYWLGIALTALGPTYRDAAVQAFERAAADPQARLFSNDGPWVAPRAAARLAELGAR